MDQDKIPTIIVGYRDQADEARRNRMNQNRVNMDVFHMRQDWSAKKPGQSTEFVPKQATATEQFVSFLKQGLVDNGDWFSITRDGDNLSVVIQPKDAEKILGRQLKKSKFYTILEDALKIGALQALMIVKIHGKWVKKYSFKVEKETKEDGTIKDRLIRNEKPVWQLQIDLIRNENFYQDPTGDGLYQIENIDIDKHTLLQMAEDNPDIYNVEAVRNLQESEDFDDEALKARETDQNVTTSVAGRKRIKVTEFWGTLLDDEGKVVMENCVCAIADDKTVIMEPRENDFWHGESPYVVAPIMRVPFSVMHKALMDAPTYHNKSLNEIWNLMLDASLMSVFGIKQIRDEWLDDPAQIDKGIPPGTTLRVSSAMPVGAKALERVDTGALSSEALQMYQLNEKEGNNAAFTSQYAQGSLPDRQVKATEIVASSQSTAGVFKGIVQSIEEEFLQPILQKAWLVCAQMMNDMDESEMKSLLGSEQAQRIAAMSPEERFAETAEGQSFKVFGMSMTLNRLNDFRKLTTLLQTIGGSDFLMQAFAQKFDMSKFLDEIVTSLNVDTDKIKNSGQAVQPPTEGGGVDMSKTPSAANLSATQEGGPAPQMSQILSGMTTPQGNEGGGGGG